MLEEKKSFIIDFGNRILNKMNFSKTICLPKQALKNLGVIEGDSLKVELVQDEDEKFLKLTPVIEDDEEEDEVRFAQELKEDDDEGIIAYLAEHPDVTRDELLANRGVGIHAFKWRHMQKSIRRTISSTH